MATVALTSGNDVQVTAGNIYTITITGSNTRLRILIKDPNTVKLRARIVADTEAIPAEFDGDDETHGKRTLVLFPLAAGEVVQIVPTKAPDSATAASYINVTELP